MLLLVVVALLHAVGGHVVTVTDTRDIELESDQGLMAVLMRGKDGECPFSHLLEAEFVEAADAVPAMNWTRLVVPSTVWMETNPSSAFVTRTPMYLPVIKLFANGLPVGNFYRPRRARDLLAWLARRVNDTNAALADEMQVAAVARGYDAAVAANETDRTGWTAFEAVRIDATPPKADVVLMTLAALISVTFFLQQARRIVS